MQYRVFLAGFCLQICFSIFSFQAEAVSSSWRYVEKRLLQNGFSRSFVRDMKQVYEPQDFHKVIEMNVLLFLRKTNDHRPQIMSPMAVAETKAFMDTYRDSLKIAEDTYGVPGPVIASLLWVETKHGRNLGRHHVASVYLSLLQADRPLVIRYLKKSAKKFSRTVTFTQKAKIVERSRKKAQWALEELRAIQKAYDWKWTSVTKLRGSFSGAFGIPQFIPSSYAKWARPQNHKGAPDLFKPEDSIHSVAYYLADSGWKQKESRSHVEALLRYNNSRDYADAILELSTALIDRPETDNSKRVAL